MKRDELIGLIEEFRVHTWDTGYYAAMLEKAVLSDRQRKAYNEHRDKALNRRRDTFKRIVDELGLWAPPW